MSNRRKSLHLFWRFPITVAGLVICSWLMWSAARVGAARLLSNYGVGIGSFDAANEAVGFSSDDPEVYSKRAAMFLNAGRAAIAADEFQQAVKLRPRDYLLWMEMGNAYDQANNTTEAIKAFQEATKLAPYYAHTHWQLGNLLLRAGRYDEAFSALRRAATSQTTLSPQLVDLTWGIYNGDAAAVEAVVQPQSSTARMALATYFAQHGKASDAIRLYRESRSASNTERQALLTALLSSNSFREAYEVWARNLKINKANYNAQSPSFIDGSFENEIRFDNPGFGWQIQSDIRQVQVSLDSREPSDGSRSLLIIWDGNPQPTTAIVSQLLLVEPQTRYQLSFDVRTKSLVTAGTPMVTVVDAGNRVDKLAQSIPFSENTNGWQKVSLSFETGKSTTAVLVSIQRQNCAMPLCPIFGQTWFDNFLLQ